MTKLASAKYRKKNKAKANAATRRWYAENKTSILRRRAELKYKRRQRLFARRSWLRKKYGLTVEEYIRLQKKAGNKCTVCREQPNGRFKTLHVDHNHETKKVRGMLCFRCNVAIGLLQDDKKIVQRILKYLEADD